MKKRFKIITTIASLCLAVALMAFGVYAATTTSLTVTSKVQFTALDVDVTWNVKVSGGDIDPSAQGAADWETAAGWTQRSNNVTGQAGIANTDNFTLELGKGTAGSKVYKFDPTDSTDGDTITYTFSITNNGGDAVKIDFTGTALFEQGADSHLTVTYKCGLAGSLTSAAWDDVNSVASGATYVYQVELLNTNMTKSVSEKTLNVSFVVDSVNNV